MVGQFADPGTGSPLLATKFHIPRIRPGWVPRERLVRLLNRGAQGKLTLLSAPPGFGKTTLLAEWFASPDRPAAEVVWLSLDAADNRPETFWSYLFTALQRARPAIERAGVFSLLETPPLPPIASLLAPVLNAIDSDPGDVVLVLDDYHIIESESVQQGLAFLLEHLPPQLHLVLASRADPALPLARLRARADLTEIRGADLRFTLPEADDYLNGRMQLGLRPEDVTRLETRTEGWAGALQLAALSLHGREGATGFIEAFSGNNRFVMDYLVEEVLDRQPPHIQGFLLRMSILDRLSAPLCDAVSERDDSAAMLETLDRSNLFLLPLDDQRQWFRFHQLFASVLRAHLVEKLPAEVPALHGRASAWFARHGEPDHAIQHALAASDFEEAAGLIELEAEAIVRRHHPDRLIELLQSIPDHVVRTMPVLSTYYGHALQGVGDLEGSAAWLGVAESLLTAAPVDAVVFDRASFEILPALIAVGRGYLAIAAGDPVLTAACASRALPLLSEHHHHWRGTALALLGLSRWAKGDLEPAQRFHSQAVACFEQSGDNGLAITSAYHNAELLRARGRLNEAEDRLTSSRAFIASQGGAAIRGVANLHLALSELLCERNDLGGAARELTRAKELGVYPPRTPFRFCLAQARLAQSCGDLEQAAALLIEAERLQVRGAVPDYRPVRAWRARIRAAQGRISEALDWVRERGLSPDDDLAYGTEFEHITLARVLLARGAEGDMRDAGRLLERLLKAAKVGGRMGPALEIAMLLAFTFWAEGDERAALSAIEPALVGAQPEGYARLFLDEAPRITPLLRVAAERGVAADYCRQLLGALVGNDLRSQPTAGPDALSDRETEVVRLLASELSGPEIANALFVSLHTLRSHTKNVYAKLGVNSRRAAVRRATELGLI